MPVAGSRSSETASGSRRARALGGTKLGDDAPLLLRVPAPGKHQAGARGEEEKDLRHG